MSDGILKPLISTALTSPRPRPQSEDRRDPEQDLDRRGVGADQERADDDAEADHRPDRQVEIPDQERVRLGDGGQREGHRQQQDRGDVGLVDEPVEPGLGVRRAGATISSTCSATGIHSRNLDDLAPLVLVAGVAGDLAGELSRPVDAGRSRLVRVIDRRASASDALLGIATPSGDRAAFDIPGPRTMASTMRTSSSSSPGISSTMVPRDITNTRSQRPESSIGSLDLTSRAAPAAARDAERRVDVDAGADVDTLGRLVGQDHRRLLRNDRATETFCWLPPDRNSTGWSSDGRADLELLDELLHRAPLGPPAQEPEPAEAPQRLDGGVHPHARGRPSTPRACDRRGAA